MEMPAQRPRPKMLTADRARELLAVPFTTAARRDRQKATDRQAAALAKLGVAAAEDLSFTAAGELLDALFGRIDRDLCSMRQLAWLVDRGIPADEAREVPFRDACGLIEESLAR